MPESDSLPCTNSVTQWSARVQTWCVLLASNVKSKGNKTGLGTSNKSQIAQRKLLFSVQRPEDK